MEHIHNSTHHHPHGAKEMRAYMPIYLKAWGLTFLIAGFELVGSILSGSFALLADITHVFTDTVVGLGPISVEFFRHRIHISEKHIEAAGGVLMSLILLFVGYYVVLEALEQINETAQHEVQGGLLFLFATLAALTNFAQHRLLSRVSPIHRHAAHAGFHFHILTDLVKNMMLPVLGLIIFLGGSPVYDVWAGLAIGGLIIARALLLIFESMLGQQLVGRTLGRFFHWVMR